MKPDVFSAAWGYKYSTVQLLAADCYVSLSVVWCDWIINGSAAARRPSFVCAATGTAEPGTQ